MKELILMLIKRVDKLEGMQTKSFNKETVECYYCHRQGHYTRNCPDKEVTIQCSKREEVASEKFSKQQPIKIVRVVF